MSREPFALDAERSALLVVDMQNDFVRAGAPQEVPQARATVPAIASLLGSFRAARRPVVFTRFTGGPRKTLLWAWSPQCGPELRSCWPGVMRDFLDRPGEELEGHAVIDELTPQPGEPVVDKYRYGSFHNTGLEQLVRALGIMQVVVTGTVTQIGVEETVREGFHRELEMVVVREGVSSFDETLARASLRNLAMKFARVDELGHVLSAIGRPAPEAAVQG